MRLCRDLAQDLVFFAASKCFNMDAKTQISALLKHLSEGVYEKQHIIAMALLSAIAGESIFLLGPPGTAKSLVARRLKLAFKDGRSFEYLMSRFSTPDEIFGPVSISLLKNEDRYERVVHGFLPTAHIVFLDEIWKASPSIQNALLTAINERIFQNGDKTLHLPMKALIAASNELPAEDEGLEALWDRFLVRMVSNCIQSETEFFKMIRKQIVTEVTVPGELLITEAQYEFWQREIDVVQIPDEICTVVSHVRKKLKEESQKEEVNAMDYYISDRRWKKCFHLLQASAFLNGRKAIDMTDIPLLVHCLWNKSEAIPTIIDAVCQSLTCTIDNQLDKIEKEVDQVIHKASAPVGRKQESNERFSLSDYFYYSVRDFPSGKCLFYKADYDYVSIDKATDGIMYRDEKKKAWIVRAIYTGAPFDYKKNDTTNVRKVQLKKWKGGIIIGRIPYGFERVREDDTTSDMGLFGKNNAATLALDILNLELTPALKKLQERFANPDLLFLSANDIKLVKKYLTKCEKRLAEVSVKVQNTQKLL